MMNKNTTQLQEEIRRKVTGEDLLEHYYASMYTVGRGINVLLIAAIASAIIIGAAFIARGAFGL